MLHIFKLNGHRIAYDTNERRAYPLSALALKIIDALTPPLTEDCPSALRYAFAKYDSNDLSAAYGELYTLYKNGLLFAEEANTAAITPDTAVITASAPAAVQKITAAVNDGAKNIHAYITNATTCLASSLHEAFDGKVTLRLILDLELTALTDDDIHSLNTSGDVLWISDGADTLTDTVQQAWNRGITAVHADIPDTESSHKELARLAKAIEASAEAGTRKEFFPFTEALFPVHPYCGTSAACADCWARLICGGRCLNESATQTSACEIQRTVTECAIILTDGV